MYEPPPPFQPMPVEPLSYETTYLHPRRPGILTAVGVISILYGAFGLLLGLVSIVALVMAPKLQTMMQASVRAAAAARAAAASQASVAQEFMPVAQRTIIVNAFDKLRPLSAPRQKMLDMLLAKTGDDPFPFAGDQITAEHVEASVSSSGRLPGSQDQPGNDFFVLANGRIEIGDEQATFSATDRRPTISVSTSESIHMNDVVASSPATLPAVFNRPLLTRSDYIRSAITLPLGMLLSLWLCIAAIMLLSGSRRSRWMHLIWAGLKLPMVLAGFLISLYASQQSLGSFGPFAAAGVTIGLIVAVIYPLAVLICMNLRAVKAYYAREAG